MREDAARALWLAVLLQAKQDNFEQPHRELNYHEAVQFLTAGGTWAHSRADIAIATGMDPDLLDRMGRQWVGERRVADGFSYELPPPSPPNPAPPRPASLRAKPQVVVSFVPPAVPRAQLSVSPPKPKLKAGNPFNPFRAVRTHTPWH